MIKVVIDARTAQPGVIRELAATLARHPGDETVSLEIRTSGGPVYMLLGEDLAAASGADLWDEVRALGAVAIPERA